MFSPKKNTTAAGNRGEDFVCNRLVESGYQILDRNVREKFAELDIVAEKDETICFIEVRTRASAALGHPAETITWTKQKHIRRAAESWLIKRRINNRAVRFDVATLIWETMTFEYFENAFGQDY